MEVPEELDVCVAQRHFEEALALLHKAKEYISQHKDNQSDHVLVDIERKVRKRFLCLVGLSVWIMGVHIPLLSGAKGGLHFTLLKCQRFT